CWWGTDLAHPASYLMFRRMIMSTSTAQPVATAPEAVLEGRASANGSEESWGSIRVAGFFLWALLVLLFLSILPKLCMDWWDDPNSSHGFLVPVFSGYLIWQHRAQLAALSPRGSWAKGLPVLLLGLGLLLLGEIGAERFLAASSLLIVLAGLVLLHLGP